MIRLYVDQAFDKGATISLPKEELRYFQSVRRGKGEVCLFNRIGQIALGRVIERGFEIDEVRQVHIPLYRVRVASALPDVSLLPMMIRGLSELGISTLQLFRGDRSQGSLSKLNLSRLERMAIEACRQCGRGQPLEILVSDVGLSDLDFREPNLFMFDEADSHKNRSSVRLEEATALLLGPEGGWTTTERDIARQKGFQNIHFRTPILRVETAAVAASLWALETVFKVSGD